MDESVEMLHERDSFSIASSYQIYYTINLVEARVKYYARECLDVHLVLDLSFYQ